MKKSLKIIIAITLIVILSTIFLIKYINKDTDNNLRKNNISKNNNNSNENSNNNINENDSNSEQSKFRAIVLSSNETYPTKIDVIKIETETQYKTKIEELPQDYTMEDAVTQNCVVTTHKEIYNKDELDTFLENVKKGIPDFIRWVYFTDEGDMLITDTNFEGSNSFRVTVDYTRDNFSSIEERTYNYCKFSKLNIEEKDGIVRIVLNGKLEGNLEETSICSYRDTFEIINNYEIKK